jgi:hypothetical protein
MQRLFVKYEKEMNLSIIFLLFNYTFNDSIKVVSLLAQLVEAIRILLAGIYHPYHSSTKFTK